MVSQLFSETIMHFWGLEKLLNAFTESINYDCTFTYWYYLRTIQLVLLIDNGSNHIWLQKFQGGIAPSSYVPAVSSYLTGIFSEPSVF